MSDKEVHHEFWYYLNPFVWIRALVSYVLTFTLVLNHFFVLILACVILVLSILFFYDRYAVATYDGAEQTEYSDSIFASHEKYDSPLARGDKYLGKELEAHYEAEKRKSEVEKARIEYERLDQGNKTSSVRNMEPIWPAEEKGIYIPISEEVRHRIYGAEQDILNSQN